MPDLSRRLVLVGACGACAVAAGACAAYGTGNAPKPSAAPPAATAAAPAGSGAAAPAGVASTADVPVGGGLILADQNLVITQPSAGSFKGFSATCTHQGCTVATVADGTINCPCHGSKYSVVDGSVQGGPAPRPLESRAVTVTGTAITLA